MLSSVFCDLLKKKLKKRLSILEFWRSYLSTVLQTLLMIRHQQTRVPWVVAKNLR